MKIIVTTHSFERIKSRYDDTVLFPQAVSLACKAYQKGTNGSFMSKKMQSYIFTKIAWNPSRITAKVFDGCLWVYEIDDYKRRLLTLYQIPEKLWM